MDHRDTWWNWLVFCDAVNRFKHSVGISSKEFVHNSSEVKNP